MDSDPDYYLWLMDLDLRGTKICGSWSGFGSGSSTLATIKDVQVTEEAVSSQKEHPALPNMKFPYIFLLLWVVFALPDPDPDPTDLIESGRGSPQKLAYLSVFERSTLCLVISLSFVLFSCRWLRGSRCDWEKHRYLDLCSVWQGKTGRGACIYGTFFSISGFGEYVPVS